MRSFKPLLLPALLLGFFAASAQDVASAYNIANSTVQGSARSMGFGNALGSVGGDFSSVSVNPAGLGIYRTSELTFTPSLRINATNSQYTGNTTPDNNTRFNINSFGLIFTNAPRGKRYDERNWKTVSFALGMNRTADFNRNYSYSGKNVTSSGSQVFEADANYDKVSAGSSDGGTLGFMGYQSYLLNLDANGNYYSIVHPNSSVNQMRSVQERGGASEYTISLGGNYKERLMLGMTIGMPTFNYVRDISYTETLAGDNNAPNPYGFTSLKYSQHSDITGDGINAKIGAIYKVNDMFRIGASFHTPTYYSITDLYNPMLTTVHNDTVATISEDNGYTLASRFNYTLTTPWKSILSATMIIDKVGFITADFEYVGYNSMRYQYSADAYGYSLQAEQDAMNQEIKKTYKGTSNFRLGGEARLAKYFMARAGFGYYGNAYTAYGQSTANSYYNTERIDLSAGVGFRFDHFFADLGYVHSMYQGYEQPYSVDYGGITSASAAVIPGAKINYGINNIALTLGVKF
ncbi:MAG: hypothetical protein JWQ38_423 [Flavipsychrobacter sp.]|nr:hypothetical protein [Flavipsychrobacter sp.]